MGLIIHLCGSVNAKKIEVVVTVVRLVLEVLVIAGVVATITKKREGVIPYQQASTPLGSYLSLSLY